MVLFLVAGQLTALSGHTITHLGLGFLTGTTWNPPKNVFGALPFVFGTVVTSAIALAVAVPVGVGVAIFLAQPGAGKVRGAIGTGVELLAAIPSVVYGLWALFIMGPWLQVHVALPVAQHLGALPVLAPPARQTSIFTASMVLAVMVLPTLAAVSRDVIKAVPFRLTEAGVAMGATWWETTRRLVLPAARAGILGASILALGRALGETIAVTMVIGNRPEISASIFSPGYTLASVVANEFSEASGVVYSSALTEAALVLVLVTLVVNVFALLMVRATVKEGRA
ncbi:MAG: phosphate ABC transporter permease subunit PstC [Candidatus Dormibacteria bacterium]